MDSRLRALNRFGLGAKINDRSGVEDPRGWLRAQLDEYRRGFDAAYWSANPGTLQDAGRVIAGLRSAQRSRDQEALAAGRAARTEVLRAESSLALSTRLTTSTPFVERLVAFWSNHLCVSVAKPQVIPLAGHYERTVVRPHVLGRFEEMVLASARHPAMLYYLDNLQSIGPESVAGRRTASRGNGRGLNENYARELLELHTVGVDGGYGQEDVEQLARVLTGWGVAGVGPAAGEADGFGFQFRPIVHEPGDKRVMGVRYRHSGVSEGESAIRDLCRHPATARFVATKLVRHFVDDEPPEAAVTRIEDVFRDSGGDLYAVSAALVDLEEAWDPERRKLRTPQDWLVAVLRALEVTEPPAEMAPRLRQLRHTLWAPPSPKGYGDTRAEWSDPDSLMNRAELARRLARRTGAGVGGGRGVRAGGGPPRGASEPSADPRALLEVVDVGPSDPLATMLADNSIPANERIALALASPAFQWR